MTTTTKFTMDPIQVECATCLALPGEHCSTRYSGYPVAPHPARSRLARASVACPRCGASDLRPCVNSKGRAQPRIHTARSEAARRTTHDNRIA